MASLSSTQVAIEPRAVSPVVVHKYGSSVLRDEEDLPRAVEAIYAALRRGRRVVAVVSAFGDTTDALIARAGRYAPDAAEPSAFASLVSTGELTSASLLTLALERAGISAKLLDATSAGLRAAGPPLDATPVAVDVAALSGALRERSVVVLPGFIARGGSGEPALLGRGGSDATALFVAQALGAPCELFKDVEGLFTADPSQGSARLFTRASWETARAVGGGVIQPKAIALAQKWKQRIFIRSVESPRGTEIGPGPDQLAGTLASRPRLKVLLLGLGSVGLGVYRQLARDPARYEVSSILVRDPHKPRPAEVPAALVDHDVGRALERPYDVMVECIGEVETAARAVRAALEAGRDVVTANKALMATAGVALEDLAKRRGARLRYGAAVGGAVPCLEAVKRLATRGVISVRGVLNGTCNFLLDHLARGCDWEEALDLARAAGLAEADPRADLNGLDAEHKLRLLARTAFGPLPCELKRTGIRSLTARKLQGLARQEKTVRLIAAAKRVGERVEAEVSPQTLPSDHPFAQVHHEGNRLEITTIDGTDEVWAGKGAGRWPSAQAVLGDLLELWEAQL